MVRSATLLVAALLAVASVAVPIAASSDVQAIDRDHELDAESKIATFDVEGVVTGNVDGIDMQLTIADKARDIGLSELTYRSSGTVFLRVDYDEEIERTVRIYLPRDYVRPQVKEGLDPVNGGAPAQLEPVNDRQYTAVTLELNGETTATYGISTSRGLISDGRSSATSLLENATGFEVPSITGNNADWKPVQEDALTGEQATHQIPSNETDITVQYDADDSVDDTRWITVRDCEKSDQPVCKFTRDEENSTHILASESDPPPVRWKADTSITDGIRNSWNDAENAVSNLKDSIGGLLGGS